MPFSKKIMSSTNTGLHNLGALSTFLHVLFNHSIGIHINIGTFNTLTALIVKLYFGFRFRFDQGPKNQVLENLLFFYKIMSQKLVPQNFLINW